MNFKKEIELQLDNDEALYTAAEKLAHLDDPTPEQYNDLAEAALDNLSNETGKQFNALDLRTALKVVKNWVKEEKIN